MIEFFTDLFAPITKILHLLLATLYSFTSGFGLVSYGYPIILLTIIIKGAMYPLTVKQIKSMKAMQELQPKLQKIQEKYRSNPEMLRQKMAELYSTAGVNPLAGCLPLLIQMPILMAMYYALYDFHYPSIEQAAFFWLDSLSEPDRLYILPLLSAITTFLQQKLTTSSEANAQMKIMLIVMPIFIGWISLTFPSGLVLYWVTMNIVQILQQMWMYRNEPEKDVAVGKDNKAEKSEAVDNAPKAKGEKKIKGKRISKKLNIDSKQKADSSTSDKGNTKENSGEE